MIGTRILYHHKNALGEKAQGFQKQAKRKHFCNASEDL
jgi:hypothetical protein